jgi:hypothetical protein
MGIYLGDKKIQLQLAPQIKGTTANKIENTYIESGFKYCNISDGTSCPKETLSYSSSNMPWVPDSVENMFMLDNTGTVTTGDYKFVWNIKETTISYTDANGEVSTYEKTGALKNVTGFRLPIKIKAGNFYQIDWNVMFRYFYTMYPNVYTVTYDETTNTLTYLTDDGATSGIPMSVHYWCHFAIGCGTSLANISNVFAWYGLDPSFLTKYHSVPFNATAPSCSNPYDTMYVMNMNDNGEDEYVYFMVFNSTGARKESVTAAALKNAVVYCRDILSNNYTGQYTDDDSDSNNKFVTNLVDNYNTLVDKYNNIIKQWGTNKED